MKTFKLFYETKAFVCCIFEKVKQKAMTKAKKKERPDQVVFNEETGKYDAALKPYGTNVGAPSIKTTQINNWKNIGINKVNHSIKQKFDELQKQYQEMMEEYKWNELIYATEFNFEPQIGETYYLYRRENESTFLSIIPPESFKMEFIGAFKLNSDKIWKVENLAETNKDEKNE